MLLVLLQVATAAQAPPAAAYWQQSVAYRIEAALDERRGALSARARIVYLNHSPDTLHDFYVHQYLNAFRPGSRWSAADSAEGRQRFQHLEDPDYAYERITRSVVMGEEARPGYPFAPDSTIAHWRLPRPLAPGDSMTVEIAWEARPSTLPRRQGRQGRRFDFAQWYPRVVVYDKLGWQAHPLYPAGEFYGEFGTYDVTLDLAADQVIGATGVPVEGDPGWERARVDAHPIDYQRRWYNPAVPTPTNPECGRAPGRKCVRFVARDVHHFAFSLNPDYRYEEGRYGDVVVRVLYLPQDSATWGGGIAVERTEAALAWLDTLFGPFPWPQITNVHRIEGGGTEFPMMVMDGSASEGLIVHEVGHNYVMGILANNEWREGWLDEGFSTFQSAWYFEARGQDTYEALERRMLQWDLDGWSEPISTQSEYFRDFATYGTMIYDKGRLFLDALRYVVGDSVMRRILRTYYDRWKLKHVDEAAFRGVAEDVSGMDLGWLFGQWLHATPLYDYRLKDVDRRRMADGSWRTTVTIERLGDGQMPVEIGTRDTIYARALGMAPEERVTFTTAERPGRLMLDPRVRTHDWDMLNNGEPRGWPFKRRSGRSTVSFDPTRHAAGRTGYATLWLPLGWYNDHGGLTLALYSRANYANVRRSAGVLSFPLHDYDIKSNRFLDPYRFYWSGATSLRRVEAGGAVWHIEGRSGVRLWADRSLKRHRTQAADPHGGFELLWMTTTDTAYVDTGRWDRGGTVEAGPWLGTTVRKDSTVWRARLDLRGGLVYRNPSPGLTATDRFDVEGYGRGILEASVKVKSPARWRFGARVFAGGYGADHAPSRQRRIYVAGADPYETFTNPLLRSRGALFVRPDFHYHAVGQGNLRAYRPDLGGRGVASVSIESGRALVAARRGVLRELVVHGFGDAGVVDLPGTRTLFDAGVGIAGSFRINDLAWTMRFDLPLFVSERALARQPDGARWVFSLEPAL